MIVPSSQLLGLHKFAEGGQGEVFSLDDQMARLVKHSGSVVAKAYLAHKRLPDDAATALIERATWAQGLDAAAREELLGACAWPLAVVMDGTRLWGLVMPDMRPRFAAPMRLPSGTSETVLVSLEHLLKDDDFLLRRFDVAIDTLARARIARSIAHSLAVLHRHGIVASDISLANIVVGLHPPYPAAFLDCDSMVFRGRSVMAVHETPSWELDPATGEEATTKAADSYKLALVVLRLFARSQSARMLHGPLPGNVPGSAAAYVPDSLHEPIDTALSQAQRPTAAQWEQLLEEASYQPLGRLRSRPSPSKGPARPSAGRPIVVPPPPPPPAPPAPPVNAPVTPALIAPTAFLRTPTPPPPASPPPRPRPAVAPAPDAFWLRRPLTTLVVVAAVVVAVALIATHGGDSSGTADRNASAGVGVQAGGDGGDAGSGDGGSQTPPAPSRPRPAAPARALHEHFLRLDRGDYAGAFQLMVPSYRAGNGNWTSVRAKADPVLNVVRWRRSSQAGASARVLITFYAHDSHPTHGSDTRCRRFSGWLHMVRRQGRWLYDPHRTDFRVNVSHSWKCP